MIKLACEKATKYKSFKNLIFTKMLFCNLSIRKSLEEYYNKNKLVSKSLLP